MHAFRHTNTNIKIANICLYYYPKANSKKCTSCNKAGHEASSCWSNQAKASADLDDGDLIDDETVTNKEIIIIVIQNCMYYCTTVFTDYVR